MSDDTKRLFRMLVSNKESDSETRFQTLSSCIDKISEIKEPEIYLIHDTIINYYSDFLDFWKDKIRYDEYTLVKMIECRNIPIEHILNKFLPTPLVVEMLIIYRLDERDKWLDFVESYYPHLIRKYRENLDIQELSRTLSKSENLLRFNCIMTERDFDTIKNNINIYRLLEDMTI